MAEKKMKAGDIITGTLKVFDSDWLIIDGSLNDCKLKTIYPIRMSRAIQQAAISKNLEIGDLVAIAYLGMETYRIECMAGRRAKIVDLCMIRNANKKIE